MNTEQIVASINDRIAALNTAKVLLADEFAVGKPKRHAVSYNKPSRIPWDDSYPKGTGTTIRVKRTISPEGRKRIAEGQKKRWAKRKAA